jgi:PKD repeat protein
LAANIHASTTSGYAPLGVQFSANGSTGSISSYSWKFGDGTTASGLIVNHTYTKVGTFTAQLTVTGTSGGSSSTATTITTVALPPLVSKITATAISGKTPLTVNFSGAGSSGLIGSYAWNFGDATTGSGATTSHTYTKPGIFTAKLVLTGVYNQSAKATVTITVSATAPKPKGMLW